MWFRSRKYQIQQQTMQKLDEITQHLGHVLDELSKHRIEVIVQNLHVDKASLERLEFHLENLDIEDLSGSLNLGNNFGTDVIRSKKDETAGIKQENPEMKQSSVDLILKEPTIHQKEVLQNGTMIEQTDRGFNVVIPE